MQKSVLNPRHLQNLRAITLKYVLIRVLFLLIILPADLNGFGKADGVDLGI